MGHQGRGFVAETRLANAGKEVQVPPDVQGHALAVDLSDPCSHRASAPNHFPGQFESACREAERHSTFLSNSMSNHSKLRHRKLLRLRFSLSLSTVRWDWRSSAPGPVAPLGHGKMPTILDRSTASSAIVRGGFDLASRGLAPGWASAASMADVHCRRRAHRVDWPSCLRFLGFHTVERPPCRSFPRPA